MKTMLATGSCFEHYGDYAFYRWYDHYSPHLRTLGVDSTCVFNDGPKGMAPARWILEVDASWGATDAYVTHKPVTVFTWPERLDRDDPYRYPGIWRNLSTCVEMAARMKFDRVIYMEWDFWIINPAMYDFIACLEEGLQTLWSPRHQIPESAFMVIGKDMYKPVYDLAAKMEDKKSCVRDDAMELVMPWTRVHRQWKGDRYTDLPAQPIPNDADFCANYGFEAGFNTDLGRPLYDVFS